MCIISAKLHYKALICLIQKKTEQLLRGVERTQMKIITPLLMQRKRGSFNPPTNRKRINCYNNVQDRNTYHKSLIGVILYTVSPIICVSETGLLSLK